MSFWKRKKKTNTLAVNQLGVPPGCEDPRAVEVLRVWLVEKRLHVVVRPDAWTSQHWGGGLLDVLRHVADAYDSQGDQQGDQQGGETPHAEMLNEMRAAFDRHPGGVPDPAHVTTQQSGRGALPHVAAAEGTEDHSELLRIWTAADQTLMSLRYSCLGSHVPWGMVASDIAASVAHAVARTGADAEAFAREVREWFDAAWMIDDPSRTGSVMDGPHQDGWQLYFSQLGIEGLTASVRFDSSLGNIAPDAHLPWRIDVRAQLSAPTDRGWPEGPEFDQIHAIEETLQLAVEQAQGLNAVVVTSGGSVTWTAYVADGERVQAELAAVLGVDATHELEIDITHDPEWERFQTLWPNALEWGFIRDLAAVRRLAAQGDDGRTPRPVEHVARVPTPAAAAEYAESLRVHGFEAIDVHEGGCHEHAEADFPVVVAFRGVHPPHEMLQRGESLRGDAARCGGEYVGWACETIATVETDETGAADPGQD